MQAHLSDHHHGLVIVAVSGGSDSLGLLFWLVQAGYRDLRAVTINHGLRSEAAQEAQFVGDVCKAHGIPHEIIRVDVSKDGNLQANARAARYEALAQAAHLHKAEAVMIGHSLDDLAETFLLNAYRGSGLDGLSAMRAVFWRHGTRFIRPVLHLRRSALREILERKEITWIDDPSNEDTRFDRVRLRKILAYAEAEGFDPRRLYLSAQNLRDEQEATRLSLQKFYEANAYWAFEGVQLALEVGALRDLPSAYLHRVFQDLVMYFGGHDYAPRKEAVETLIARLWAEDRGRATLGGCLFEMRRGHCFVSSELAALPEPRVGQWHFWRCADGAILGPMGKNALRDVTLRDAGVSARAFATTPCFYENGMPFLTNAGEIILAKPFPYAKIRVRSSTY